MIELVNIFKHFSETSDPIELLCHTETPFGGGSGHMTKMATTLIYGKSPSFSRTRRLINYWALEWYAL